MISLKELKDYAKIKTLNLGQAEKDYFQNILLFLIFQEYGNELVFKGGTALSKCYGLNRFSEDLDFTSKDKFNFKKIISGLNRFRLDYESKIKEGKNSIKITLRIKGPLYINIRQSLCKIILDMSLREQVILKPIIKNIGRFLEEIPSFDVFVMQEEEILAEKIRAILTRTKARDIYDLWFLIKRKVKLNKRFISKKLEFYDLKWDPKIFKSHIIAKHLIWQSELKPLIKNVPKFETVKKEILKQI